jgi:hypothetical protein
LRPVHRQLWLKPARHSQRRRVDDCVWQKTVSAGPLLISFGQLDVRAAGIQGYELALSEIVPGCVKLYYEPPPAVCRAKSRLWWIGSQCFLTRYNGSSGQTRSKCFHVKAVSVPF